MPTRSQPVRAGDCADALYGAGSSAERAEAFVAGGGHLVTTYWSGIVDESDLCHLGGFPGPLRKLLGIWQKRSTVSVRENVIWYRGWRVMRLACRARIRFVICAN